MKLFVKFVMEGTRYLIHNIISDDSVYLQVELSTKPSFL